VGFSAAGGAWSLTGLGVACVLAARRRRRS
jgi:MYXO-CTERM domain-containing protein